MLTVWFSPPLCPQFQAVNGDLYGTNANNSLIWEGIEGLVGRTHTKCGNGGHWDNWKDMHGVKHKGAGVDAVQKARGDPQKYGLSHNRAITGPLPERLKRDLPPLPSKKPSTLTQFIGNIVAPGVTPAANSPGPFDSPGMGHAGQALLMQLLKKQLADKEIKLDEGPPPPPSQAPPPVTSWRL